MEFKNGIEMREIWGNTTGGERTCCEGKVGEEDIRERRGGGGLQSNEDREMKRKITRV